MVLHLASGTEEILTQKVKDPNSIGSMKKQEDF